MLFHNKHFDVQHVQCSCFIVEWKNKMDIGNFLFFYGGGEGEGVYLNINKSLVTGYVEQEGLFYCILVDLGDNLKFLIHSSINIIWVCCMWFYVIARGGVGSRWPLACIAGGTQNAREFDVHVGWKVRCFEVRVSTTCECHLWAPLHDQLAVNSKEFKRIAREEACLSHFRSSNIMKEKPKSLWHIVVVVVEVYWNLRTYLTPFSWLPGLVQEVLSLLKAI